MDQQPPAELIAQWQARGMIVLPRFYADAEIDAVLDENPDLYLWLASNDAYALAMD
jgi:hypothetical protein